MTEDEVLELFRSLPGTAVSTAAPEAPTGFEGASFAIYDPDGDLPPQRQQPFATVLVRDAPGWDADVLERWLLTWMKANGPFIR